MRANRFGLERIRIWRHVIVLLVVLGCAALGWFGAIGAARHGERFDAKQITISPGGGEKLNYREVVDEDFGSDHRHGYERDLRDDFGIPENVTASSPNANADVQVVTYDGVDTTIRIGDPDVTFQNQHRYILDYTLPAAKLSSRILNVAVIDPGEAQQTQRFDIVLTGFRLSNTFCTVGPNGSTSDCRLTQHGSDYTVSFTPLYTTDGVTLGGTIDGYTDVVLPPVPALPTYRTDHRHSLGLLLLLIGLGVAMLILLVDTVRGRDEVARGGAVEAAFAAPRAGGPQPLPGPTGAPGSADVQQLTGGQLDTLATTEFAPPEGLEPWHGAVLLSERVDEHAVAAWFSGVAARDGIALAKDGEKLQIGPGEHVEALSSRDQQLVAGLLPDGKPITLGSYNALFSQNWEKVRAAQVSEIQDSGWWKRQPPGVDRLNGRIMKVVLVVLLWVLVAAAAFTLLILGLLGFAVAAILFAVVVPAAVAFVAYGVLLPVRSATGSALAIRTESFRRFLVASEGRHVEWAWKQGLLREYSAWAVALGAAEAWGKALETSDIPPPERLSATPMLVYSLHSSLHTSHATRSTSSSGRGFSGGGGFRSGGGGGSSGSW
ncbi:MAG: putative rane protein [Ilumatobacteraceae bacterium]|nr:putative rane protein [Ilumatobacteraceae bacterium]